MYMYLHGPPFEMALQCLPAAWVWQKGPFGTVKLGCSCQVSNALDLSHVDPMVHCVFRGLLVKPSCGLP